MLLSEYNIESVVFREKPLKRERNLNVNFKNSDLAPSENGRAELI